MKRTLTLSLLIAFFTLSLSAQDASTLVGNWKEDMKNTKSNQLLHGAQFNFKSDGTFSRIKSENSSLGTWSIKDKTLVLEYKERTSSKLPKLTKNNSDSDRIEVDIIELSPSKLVLKYGDKPYTLVRGSNTSISTAAKVKPEPQN